MNNRLLGVLALLLVHACATYQGATAPSLTFDDTARQTKVEVEGVLLMAKAIHHESERIRSIKRIPQVS